jgi:hypothetical protein
VPVERTGRCDYEEALIFFIKRLFLRAA